MNIDTYYDSDGTTLETPAISAPTPVSSRPRARWWRSS
jgi:hypothetical protein